MLQYHNEPCITKKHSLAFRFDKYRDNPFEFEQVSDYPRDMFWNIKDLAYDAFPKKVDPKAYFVKKMANDRNY